MPPALQTRLLRVLQDGRFYRVGGHEQVETNVRIVAATNQNLEQRVKEGRFREDLFHRLNVIRIHLPPLRERREDIPGLARHFIKRSATELGVEAKRLAPEAEEYLSRLPWPGNVRQLEDTCRWLTVMAPGQVIRVEDLPPELRQSMQDATVADSDWEARLRLAVDQRLLRGDADIFPDINACFERVLIEAALRRNRRTQTGCRQASRLGPQHPDAQTQGTAHRGSNGAPRSVPAIAVAAHRPVLHAEGSVTP